MSEIPKPYIEDECPMCCNKKPVVKFVCKNCADSMYGTGEELTDLKRRLHRAVKALCELRDKCNPEIHVSQYLTMNLAIDTILNTFPELEE